MTAVAPTSPWRSRFAREIALILALKLVILFTIKMIWFDTPTPTPVDSTARTSAHLFGAPTPAPTPNSRLPKEP